MKRLKFADNLIEKVLSGEKTSTWRLQDDKNLQKQEIISLCTINRNEFAKAKITLVKEITFNDLTEEDFKNHETYSSEKEMYDTYSEYYNISVGPDTELKIVMFKVI